MLEGDWIRIEDKLPEINEGSDESEDVLVYESGNYHIAALQFYPKRGYRLKDEYEWVERSTGCGCCEKDINPTHWMRLPNAPKPKTNT